MRIIAELWRRGIPCLFHLYTGWYCPGCGGTRAVKALLKGDLWLSFQYHPIILYTILIFAAAVISWGFARLFKNPRLFIKHLDIYTYVGLGILTVNWIIKNYMLIAKGIDLLP